MVLHIRDVGLRIDMETLRRGGTYGLPLVGGALAMFVLGACDRWFLAAAVPAAELGFYGLAAKLSFIVPLAMQPFGLWWYAQRIRVLSEPDGLTQSARMIAVGMALLGVGVAVTCTGAPILIENFLPAPYRSALAYLPWLALIAVLNEMCSLVNVGVYAARNAYGVLVINSVGAFVAFTGYVALVPHFGVAGAIAATIAGQSARLALFLRVGSKLAPIVYPWSLCAAIVFIDLALLRFVSSAPGILAKLVVLTLAVAVLGLLAWRAVATRPPATQEALA